VGPVKPTFLGGQLPRGETQEESLIWNFESVFGDAEILPFLLFGYP
jgi:hypothetical protein